MKININPSVNKRGKKIIIVIMVVTMLFICSCDIDREALADKVNDTIQENTKPITTLKKVIKSINEKDNMALKKLFSKETLSNSQDIDNDIKKLFEYIDEKIESYDYGVGANETEEIEHGLKLRQCSLEVNIATNSNKYILYLIENTVSRDDPHKIGIYSMQIISEENNNEDFRFEYEKCAGIIIWTPEIINNFIKNIDIDKAIDIAEDYLFYEYGSTFSECESITELKDGIWTVTYKHKDDTYKNEGEPVVKVRKSDGKVIECYIKK